MVRLGYRFFSRGRVENIAGKIYFVGCGELIMVHYAADTISDDEFELYCDRLLTYIDADGPKPVALLFGDYPPNANQRRLIKERMEKKAQMQAKRVALVSESALVRGALTAIGWLLNNPDNSMRAFAGRDIDGALSWLAKEAIFDQAKAKQAHAALRQAGNNTAA